MASPAPSSLPPLKIIGEGATRREKNRRMEGEQGKAVALIDQKRETIDRIYAPTFLLSFSQPSLPLLPPRAGR